MTSRTSVMTPARTTDVRQSFRTYVCVANDAPRRIESPSQFPLTKESFVATLDRVPTTRLLPRAGCFLEGALAVVCDYAHTRRVGGREAPLGAPPGGGAGEASADGGAAGGDGVEPLVSGSPSTSRTCHTDEVPVGDSPPINRRNARRRPRGAELDED